MKPNITREPNTTGKPALASRVAMAAMLMICAYLASCLTSLEGLPAGLTAPTSTRITNQEAISALKDALAVGIKASSAELGRQDGYFANQAVKILLPPEAKPMMDMASKIPQGKKLIDDVVLRLNRSAEEAAKEVVPIFIDAITSMTISDGIALVKGGNKSATEYLERKTRDRLYSLYLPKVDSALSKPLVMDVSAKKSWSTLVTNYNKAGKPVNAAARLTNKKEPMPAVDVDLSRYATNKGLDGLFYYIGQEELKIRENPLNYASSIIKKVFGAAKKGLL